MDLREAGWTSREDDAFAAHRSSGLQPARVAAELNHIYRLWNDQGEVLAEGAGRLRRRKRERFGQRTGQPKTRCGRRHALEEAASIQWDIKWPDLADTPTMKPIVRCHKPAI